MILIMRMSLVTRVETLEALPNLANLAYCPVMNVSSPTSSSKRGTSMAIDKVLAKSIQK